MADPQGFLADLQGVLSAQNDDHDPSEHGKIRAILASAGLATTAGGRPRLSPAVSLYR
jgi:hypothetical protein